MPILNIDCQKYIFGPINVFIVSGMRIFLPGGSTPILPKTALPLGFDLYSLSLSMDSVPRAFHDTLWEGHLSSILYMERGVHSLSWQSQQNVAVSVGFMLSLLFICELGKLIV